MSQRAQVPEGCVGVDFPDGSKANAHDRSGVVELTPRQAMMARYYNDPTVRLIGSATVAIRGDAARWVECTACGRDFLAPLEHQDETKCVRHRAAAAASA